MARAFITDLEGSVPQKQIDWMETVASHNAARAVADFLADTRGYSTEGTPTPYVVGRRIQIGPHFYQVAAIDVTDYHLANAGGVKLYVLPDAGGALSVEAFGAGAEASGATNAAAIKKALEVAKDGQRVCQRSAQLIVDAFSAAVTSSSLNIKLNIKFSGSGVSAVCQITGASNSLIDVSVDADSGDLHALRCDGCNESIVPRTAVLKNVSCSTQASAGLFCRDSADMILEPKVENISGDGSVAVRGIWISDTTLTVNRTRISPLIDGVTITTGETTDDADGVFCENSNGSHWGGVQVIGGWYNDCQKRNIKINSARPTIQGNKGRNSLTVTMYSFVSCYHEQSGVIAGNEFEKTGANGVSYLIDVGAQTSTDNTYVTIEGNRVTSATVAASSKGIRVGSVAAKIVIGENEIVGVETLLQQYGSTAATGQLLSIGAVRFDNLSGSASNAIVLTGAFEKCRVEGVTCRNAVASRYFLTAANCASKVVEIVDVRQSYSFGGWQIPAGRPLSFSDQTRGALNSYTIIDGKYHYLRNSAPTAGAHEEGDKYWRDTLSTGAGNYIGGACTTAGSPGTWTNFGEMA